MNSEYLTIKEFANKAGVSAQYVYKQIRDGKLTEYTEIIDGKRYLKPEALEKIGKQKHDNKESTNEQTIVSFLQDQLNAKDKQIAELQTALQRSQELLKREQDIIAVTQKRLLLLEGDQAAGAEEPTGEAEEAVTGDSGAVTEASGGADQEQNDRQTSRKPTAEHIEKRRLSFWDRIKAAIRG